MIFIIKCVCVSDLWRAFVYNVYVRTLFLCILFKKNVKPLKNILTLNKTEIALTTVISGLLNILEPYSIKCVLTIEMFSYLPF